MQVCNYKKMHLKKSSLAIFTAIYVGTSGYAAAEPEFKKLATADLYEPTFTAQDVENYTANKQSNLQQSLLRGKVGELNKHYNVSRSKTVFTPKQGVNGLQTYIVQLKDEPISSYRGGVNGYAATAMTNSKSVVVKERLDIRSREVRTYQHYLKDRQTSVLSAARNHGANIKVKKQLTIANNIAIVEMTQADALLLAKQSGVKQITENRVFELKTDRGPEFIGADKVWQGQQETGGVGVQGEGMVVGIIDTGINTDHPAFASDEQYAQANPLGSGNYLGDCQAEPTLCNDKLIGVRSYSEITLANSDYVFARENRRAENGEDYNGHGSHTASTAAGNIIENVPLQGIDGNTVSDGVDQPFNFPKTSGVAPRAHIVAYQVCWPGNAGDPYVGCPESAILSAFEDAIEDGVDVINFSIGGGESLPWEDPTELAFLNARKAGISVAAAAGNSGPAYYSADHTSPWVTTVGASSHDRVSSFGDKTLSSFQGDRAPSSAIEGKSFSGGITGNVVLAENFPDPNESDEFSVASCNVPFPENTFTADQIVLCERGGAPRVDKAKNIAAGGAGGFILQNVDYQANNIVADEYVLPGINISTSARYQIRNWVNANPDGAVATISEAQNTYEFDPLAGNELAIFSSMGPSATNDSLVPDLTAPGVDIYAANADEQPFTANPAASDWTFMSGTSMASPHAAGAMALLMQLHPDWTPAEIQSALMMTAQDVKIRVYDELIDPYYNFMAGAGAINVANAAKAGLVMDVPLEEYEAANPNNGGIVSWLNTASMVDMNCELTCSWMRTVTATKDGSWSAQALGWTADGKKEEAGIYAAVTPSNFSLKAGESQDILVTMTLPNTVEHNIEPEDPSLPWSMVQNLNTLFNGKVILKESNGGAPDAHLPIVARNTVGAMPLSVDVDMARNQGSETIIVNTDSYSQFTPRYYGLVKPEEYTVTLPGAPPFVTQEYVNDTWDVRSITVPEGAKRLVAKVASTERLTNLNELDDPRFQKAFSHLIIGHDRDLSGGFMPSQDVIDSYSAAVKDALYDEMVCYSSSASEANYCSIVDPVPGTYWIATANVGVDSKQMYESTTHYAVVMSDADTGNITVEGPSDHDGNGNYPLSINWDMSDAKVGDVFYGGFDLGSMPGAEGTLGFTALNLTRDPDAIGLQVNQDSARSMDVVDISVKLKANYESNGRDYNIKLNVPDGLRVAPETLTSNTAEVAEQINIEGNQLSISGTQQSTRNVKRDYKVTTNVTDEMCHTPLIDEYSTGGYIDLHSEFGMQPNADFYQGGARDYFDVPVDWLFLNENAEFNLYNQPSLNEFRMHPVGVIQMSPAYWVMSQHRGPGFLMEAMSPFWRGTFGINYKRHFNEPEGLTLATQNAQERPDLGDLLFMEFDNITDSETGSTFDYEVILRSGIDMHPGMHEIIFAYNNLAADLAKGAVFLEGGDSEFSKGGGFKDGALSNVLGFDNLDEVLQDDMVVCFDYVGPEQSEVELSFKAAVLPSAKGTIQNIAMEYQLANAESKTLMHAIEVAGNLKLSALEDMTVAENSRIDNIEVTVLDADKSPNELVVTGEGITAEVDGMSFNLIPDPHFHGETYVTVTVQDKAEPSDKASRDFLLTVVSDGEPAPVSIVDIADMTIMENQASESIMVELSRESDEEFALSVDAENASANIEGMAFSLMPTANYFGEVPVTVTLTGDNSVLTTEFTLTVTPSDLEIIALADISLMENTSSEMINVELSRETAQQFTLSVAAENAVATVSDKAFSITPNANFYGDIPVTVTLTSGDKSLTAEFTLSVLSDGKELGCIDPTATNFDSSANTDDGSCEYEEIEEADESGSFGYIALLMLPLLALRRRKSLGELK